jgi:hypothetical protein
MEEFTEIGPGNFVRLFQGFNPTSCNTFEVHTGDFDPSARRNIIHFKIILSLGNPETCGITLIKRKVELWQATIVGMMDRSMRVLIVWDLKIGIMQQS